MNLDNNLGVATPVLRSLVAVPFVWTLLAAPLLSPSPAFAIDRLIRIFDQSHGLPTDTIVGIAQDPAGFLWIATPGGLVRFDGAQMRRWGGTDRSLAAVRTSVTGKVLVLDTSGAVFTVLDAGLVPVGGPDGALLHVQDLAFDASGALWVVRGPALLRQSPDGRWMSFAADRFEDGPLRYVRADGDGVLVLTLNGVWAASANGEVRRLAATPGPVDAVRRVDGSLVVLARDTVYVDTGGGLVEICRVPGRGIALAVRGHHVWASYDRFLARVTPNEPPMVIGPSDGLPSGGPLLTDREGSLWVASFRGLLQLPEPDTITWTESEGLPTSHTRFIGRNADGIWISTWGGLARLPSERALRADPPVAPHLGEVCIDAAGTLWFGDRNQLVTIVAGRRLVRSWPRFGRFRKCTRSADGNLWLGLGKDLVKTGPSGLRAAAHPFQFTGQGFLAPLLEDRTGRLWLAYDTKLCHARVATLMTHPDWRCEVTPNGQDVIWMIESGNGEYWVAMDGDGVYRYKPGAWRQIPASRALGGGQVFKLLPSSAGGTWILSLGMPTRVVDEPSSSEGWRVVETLSAWHGHPTGGAGDLLEEPDGAIWTASAAGAVRISAAARRFPSRPLRVELTGVTVDGRLLPFGATPLLTHRQNFVDLRFAALTYRDRARVRYQARLSETGEWANLTGGEPVFRFPELPAGNYLAEVRASLDGQAWSDEGARLAFRVVAPWYRRSWFIALVACGFAAALFAVHRARVAMLLNLERQRTRIAMDLHDEIGSGLGSIGILASLVSDDRMDESRRRSVAAEVAETAADLGVGLADIVWSLRRDSRSLQDLVDHLAGRGARLFPTSVPAFGIDADPDIKTVSLSPAVQRNVLQIVQEALHNAVRHAHPTRVLLRVKPGPGRRWTLDVVDNGTGFAPPLDERESGMGLRNMARRAAAIDAALRWSLTAGGGTTVTLAFDPDARERPI